MIKEEFARIVVRSECPKAYIECGMQTASQDSDVTIQEYCAPQPKGRGLRRFVEAIQRMQRAHRKFGEGGVD
jgi:hypothetical protein